MVVDVLITWALLVVCVGEEVLSIHFHRGQVAVLVQIVVGLVKFQKVKLVGRVMVQVVILDSVK